MLGVLPKRRFHARLAHRHSSFTEHTKTHPSPTQLFNAQNAKLKSSHVFNAHNAQMKKSPCGKGYTTCLCFLIECPNYLNQFYIVLLAELSCKNEFFLNTEIFYKFLRIIGEAIAPPAPPVPTPLQQKSLQLFRKK